MAPQTIYRTASLKSVPLVNTSVWTFLFRGEFGDRFPHASDEPAFIDAATGKTVTRGELKTLSLALAYGLTCKLERLGGPKLLPGSTVLIFSPNTIHFPVLLLGAIAAGIKYSLANSAYTAQELRHQFYDSKADAVLVHPDLVDVVLEMLSAVKASRDIVIVASYEKHPEFPCLQDLITNETLKQEVQFKDEKANETVILCYSSGTTGLSKGVEVS